jgi:hypothetical protein
MTTNPLLISSFSTVERDNFRELVVKTALA